MKQLFRSLRNSEFNELADLIIACDDDEYLYYSGVGGYGAQWNLALANEYQRRAGYTLAGIFGRRYI